MNCKTATTTALAVTLGFGLAIAVPLASQAHTPDLTCRGDTLHLSLTNYPAGSTVTAVLDGVTLLDGATFGPGAYTASQAIDVTTEHTYSVTVRGSDGQGNRDYAGNTSALCGYTPTPPVTEAPTPEPTTPVTPEPTDEPSVPTPTDEPTTPVTPEPTDEPTPGGTPSPTTPVTPEPTPSATVPVTSPTPTARTTSPAPSSSVPAEPARTTTDSAAPVAADTSRREGELAYTGADFTAPAIIAAVLLAAGVGTLVYRRRMINRRNAR